jgi:hypothetical protein
MRVRVTALRRAGRRYHDRSQEGVEGHLRVHATMTGQQASKVARLCAESGAPRDTDLLPVLYEPELVAVGNGSLLLRGYESAGGVGYVQEWRCELRA